MHEGECHFLGEPGWVGGWGWLGGRWGGKGYAVTCQTLLMLRCNMPLVTCQTFLMLRCNMSLVTCQTLLMLRCNMSLVTCQTLLMQRCNMSLVTCENKGGPENPKAKRHQTNLSNNWFISLLPLASIFLEDEHYGRIHCKFHFFSSARKH